MNNTPDSPAKTPDDRTDQGGNYWTLFTPGIWKVLHAVLHAAFLDDGVGAIAMKDAEVEVVLLRQMPHAGDEGLIE
jgi:hypothetical protein